jgi:hypothetical protein
LATNRARIWIGGLAGGVVWVIWSLIVQMAYLAHRYPSAQASGHLLNQSRYPFFVGQWIATLLVLGVVMAHLYAWCRASLGPGPKTALKVGFLVGFAAGFPENFAQASWSPLARAFPTAWMLEMWLGAIFAALAAGYLYRD